MLAAVAAGDDHGARVLPVIGKAAIPVFVVLIGGGFPAIIATDKVTGQGLGFVHHILRRVSPIYAAIAENSSSLFEGWKPFLQPDPAILALGEQVWVGCDNAYECDGLATEGSIAPEYRAGGGHVSDLGTAQAEQVVTRVLGELALAMSGLAAQVRAHEMQDLARQLRCLQRLSEQLGMLSLSQVAGDLRIRLDRGDPDSLFGSLGAPVAGGRAIPGRGQGVGSNQADLRAAADGIGFGATGQEFR